MNPVASVIMPCYNVERYVVSALESVCASTLADFEIIAVDDGSTDRTGERLAAFAARERRLVVLSQENLGVSAARNRGLDAARGTYVFFVDPDDRIHPEMLARGVARLEATKADCCLFAYRRRFGETGAWQTMSLQGVYEYSSREAILAEFFPHLFGYSNAQAQIWNRRGDWRRGREEGSVCRGVYRLDLIRRANVRFDESIVLYEDAMFNCEYLLACSTMTCLDEPLYDYTVRPAGAVTANQHTRVLFTNKLRLLDRRKALDRLSGGRLTDAYSASCVFSVLEMLHALVFTGVKLHEGLPILRAYLKDDVTRRALKRFPLSVRRPLVALVVGLLRLIF